jgi:hypothetical protein
LLEANDEEAFQQRDLVSGKVQKAFSGHTDGVTHVACSPDGRTYASASKDDTVRLWDAVTGQELRQLDGHSRTICCLAFSPDSATLAGGGGIFDDAIYLWEVPNGKLLRKLEGHTYRVGGVAFAPDGKTLVSASPDGTCRIWDLATGKEVRRLTDEEMSPGDGFTSVAFSPSGRFFVTGSKRETVRFWEVASGQIVSRFRGHQGPAKAVAFAPDARTVASASHDSTVLVWDVTGQMVGGRLPVKVLAGAELEALWTDLASPDAARAHRALWGLVCAPEQSLPYLHEHLKLPPAPDPQRLVRLLADLESDRFEDRQKAAEALEQLGELAEPALRKALTEKPLPELRRRAEQLLENLNPLQSPHGVRQLRALEVIERIGTPEARRVLEALAKGLPEARRTQEAKATLQRLGGAP